MAKRSIIQWQGSDGSAGLEPVSPSDVNRVIASMLRDPDMESFTVTTPVTARVMAVSSFNHDSGKWLRDLTIK